MITIRSSNASPGDSPLESRSDATVSLPGCEPLVRSDGRYRIKHTNVTIDFGATSNDANRHRRITARTSFTVAQAEALK